MAQLEARLTAGMRTQLFALLGAMFALLGAMSSISALTVAAPAGLG